MTEHEHTPPVRQFDERWLSARTLYLSVGGQALFLTREKALAITEQLQVEVSP